MNPCLLHWQDSLPLSHQEGPRRPELEGGFLTSGPPGKPLPVLTSYKIQCVCVCVYIYIYIYIFFFFFNFASTLNILNSSGVYFLYVTMVLLSGYILKPHEELLKIVLLSELHFRSAQ